MKIGFVSVALVVLGMAQEAAHAQAALPALPRTPSGWVAIADFPHGVPDDDISDVTYDVQVDAGGAVYVTGSTRVQLSPAYTDILTLKYAPDGTLLWHAIYGGPAGVYDKGTRVRVDGSGNVYVLGTSQARAILLKYSSSGSLLATDVDVQGSTSEAVRLEIAPDGSLYALNRLKYIASDPWDAFFLIRFAPDGTRFWERLYDNGNLNPYKEDTAVALAVDSASNAYVVGRSHSGTTADREDYVTLKYNPQGSLLWSDRHDAGISDFPRNIAVSSFNDVYVVGDAYLGNTNVGLVVKYSSTGQFQWESSRDLGWSEEVRGVAVDPAGNVCVAGSAIFFGASNYDWAVSLFDSNGLLQWTARYQDPEPGSSDHASRVVADTLGNFFVTGRGGDAPLLPVDDDILVMQLDPLGNQVWLKRYDIDNDKPAALALGSSGNVYITGVILAQAIRAVTIKTRR